MHPTADRPTVVPNDGEPRAWAVTGRGRARPATPPVSHRARGPDNTRRDAPSERRAGERLRDPDSARRDGFLGGGWAGDAFEEHSRRAGTHIEQRGSGRAKKALGLKWLRASRWHRRNSAMLRGSTSGKRPGPHSAKLLRNPFHCQKGPKAILATRLAPPHKAGSRPGRLPTRKTRRASFPRRHKHLLQSWGANKSRRPNSGDSGISPCSATLFGPSKRRGAART